MLERDYPKEIVEIPEQLKDRLSKQNSCPTCKVILPKAIYERAKKPLYCLWCGQRLKYPIKSEKEIAELDLLNKGQKKLLDRVDNILEGKEY